MGEWSKLAVAGLALFTLLTAGKASAQVPPPNAAPPAYSEVDANGVDLASGALNLTASTVSVGPIGDGGLARTFIGRGLRDNLTGTIESLPNPIQGFPDAEIYFVSFGATSAVFIVKNPTVETYEPHMNASGQTLTRNASTNVYTYTGTDGTVALFDGNLHQQAFSSLAQVTSVTAPNGDKLTYHYASSSSSCAPVNCVRLQAVTSNRGYMIKYQYAGSEPETGSLTLTKVTALNLGYDYCDPLAASCTFANAWSSMTLAGTEFGTGAFTMTDSLGRVATYTLTDNKVTQVAVTGGPSVSYAYNTDGRVQSVQTAAGTWTYGYTTLAGNKLQTTVTDPLSHTNVVVSDGVFHRMLSFTDGVGNTTSFLYDWGNDGRLQQVTYPEGNITGYGYDTRGNVNSVTQMAKPGAGLPNFVTTSVFPTSCANPKTCNKPTSVTAAGATTDFTYDATHGGVLTVTAPAGVNGIRPQTRYTYTAYGATYKDATGVLVTQPATIYLARLISSCATQTTCLNTADETKIQHYFGGSQSANNLLIGHTTFYQNNAILARTSYDYTVQRDVSAIDGPLASPIIDKQVFRYNSERQVVGEIGIDPDGAGSGRRAVARKTQYRPDGQVDWVESGTVATQTDNGWNGFIADDRVTIGYDAAGRKVSETLTAGGATRALTQYSYDVASRLDCVAVRMNSAAFASPPTSACVLGTAGADGPDRIVKYGYDNADRQVLVISAYGTADQRVAAATTYRPNGQVETVADGNENLTTYEYDGFDRPKRTRLPSPTVAMVSSTIDYTEFTYDNATWNLSSDRRRDGTVVTYGYDARGNATSKSAPNATYTYDNYDRVRTGTEGGQTLTTAYDSMGRVTSQTGALGVVGYEYDAASRRTKMAWPDAFYVTYDYDTAGAVTAIRENGATALATFSYDNQGRRTSLTRTNGVVTSYGYDPISRLQTLTQNLGGTDKDQTLTFAYNPASQIISRTSTNTAYAWTGLYNVTRNYGVNGLNQVTSSGAQAITHDPRGNLNSDGVSTYSYDVANRLTGTGAGATLSYDPGSRLYQTTSSGGTVTRFAYDGLAMIGEYNSSGAIQRRYIHGPGLDEPLVWYEGSSTSDRRFLVADQQGSVVAITDGAGTATTVDTYDDHGIPGAGNQGRFQYTGQAWIPELGLYHYKGRAYSPTLGRFLQTDPSGYGDGLNMYVYVGGDPVNLSDPLGLCATQTGSRICLPRDGAGPNGNGGSNGGATGSGSGSGSGGSNSGGYDCVGGYCASTQTGDFGGVGGVTVTGVRLGSPIAPFGFYGATVASFGGVGGGGGGAAAAPSAVEELKRIYCSIPTFGGSGSIRGYGGLGGGFVADLAFDPRSGRIGGTVGIDVGVGLGGGLSVGDNVTVGRSVPNGLSASVGVNANVRAGPLAAGVSATLIGKSGPGFGGVSAGLRGGTGLTANANIGARVGGGFKVLPAC